MTETGQILACGEGVKFNDPHLNLIQLYHNSPRGLSQLQLCWPETPDVYFSDKTKGSTTFTQPGNITSPHVDGLGLSQLSAQLDGCKVWIVWPPSESNLRAVQDHERAIGPNRECRLEVWLECLENPQVFLIRKGDSFFLGPSVVHACVSVTSSAHYGIFCWERKSLEVAKLDVKILRDGLDELRRTQGEQKKRRSREDKNKHISPLELRKRTLDREEEDSKYKTCMEFYQGFKQEWEELGKEMWHSMNKESSSDILKAFLKDTEKFMGCIH